MTPHIAGLYVPKLGFTEAELNARFLKKYAQYWRDNEWFRFALYQIARMDPVTFQARCVSCQVGTADIRSEIVSLYTEYRRASCTFN